MAQFFCRTVNALLALHYTESSHPDFVEEPDANLEALMKSAEAVTETSEIDVLANLMKALLNFARDGILPTLHAVSVANPRNA